MTVDEGRLMEFVGRFIGELGATMGAGNVVVGDRLGLYRALAGDKLRPDELASRTGTATRYVEEWLRGQAAGGYVQFEPDTGRYWLTAEQEFALTDPGSSLFLPGAFELALGALQSIDRITDAFRTGDGVAWGDQAPGVFSGCERFFRPGYAANLMASWLPALDGVTAKLERGGLVADVGCGHGASTVLMAQTYTNTTFRGSDAHQGSVEQARKRAVEAGVAVRTSFETASAQDFDGLGYDLVTTFDCLHDMGDPLGAARHIRESLAPDGTWMIVEPYSADTVTGNLTPVGRVYYSFSSFLCVPNALSQGGGYALGAQAGELQIRRVVRDVGFTQFRRVAETPFNLVYEARQ